MARRQPSKVIVHSDGRVMLRRPSGWHNPIGRVRKSGGMWIACGLPRGVALDGNCENRKTKSAAVLHVVKLWQRQIGLRPGQLDF